MEELIKLLKDGRSRTTEMLAMELNTSVEIVLRDIGFLERTGVIKRVMFSNPQGSPHSCKGCTGCSSGQKACATCMPEGGFKNMGVMWEIADR